MFQVDFFTADGQTVILRYFLMMAVALIAGFSEQWWLAFLCLPIFISALAGLKLSFGEKKKVVHQKPSVIVLKMNPLHKKAS